MQMRQPKFSPFTSNNLDAFSGQSDRSVFVRDLPFCCTTESLVELFERELGIQIEEAIVCRNTEGKTLQYGCILFAKEDDVQLAIEKFTDYRFFGRNMRITRYNKEAMMEPSSTGAVLISFKGISPDVELITEETLRAAFEPFGEIAHISIRSHLYNSYGIQGGFGFLSFIDPEINSKVIQETNQTVIRGVQYDCNWSKHTNNQQPGGEGSHHQRSNHRTSPRNYTPSQEDREGNNPGPGGNYYANGPRFAAGHQHQQQQVRHSPPSYGVGLRHAASYSNMQQPPPLIVYPPPPAHMQYSPSQQEMQHVHGVAVPVPTQPHFFPPNMELAMHDSRSFSGSPHTVPSMPSARGHPSYEQPSMQAVPVPMQPSYYYPSASGSQPPHLTQQAVQGYYQQQLQYQSQQQQPGPMVMYATAGTGGSNSSTPRGRASSTPTPAGARTPTTMGSNTDSPILLSQPPPAAARGSGAQQQSQSIAPQPQQSVKQVYSGPEGLVPSHSASMVGSFYFAAEEGAGSHGGKDGKGTLNRSLSSLSSASSTISAVQHSVPAPLYSQYAGAMSHSSSQSTLVHAHSHSHSQHSLIPPQQPQPQQQSQGAPGNAQNAVPAPPVMYSLPPPPPGMVLVPVEHQHAGSGGGYHPMVLAQQQQQQQMVMMGYAPPVPSPAAMMLMHSNSINSIRSHSGSPASNAGRQSPQQNMPYQQQQYYMHQQQQAASQQYSSSHPPAQYVYPQQLPPQQYFPRSLSRSNSNNNNSNNNNRVSPSNSYVAAPHQHMQQQYHHSQQQQHQQQVSAASQQSPEIKSVAGTSPTVNSSASATQQQQQESQNQVNPRT